jgi:hypothetical protein
MHRSGRENFFGFVTLFFGILLASLSLTVMLSRYDMREQGASVFEAALRAFDTR